VRGDTPSDALMVGFSTLRGQSQYNPPGEGRGEGGPRPTDEELGVQHAYAKQEMGQPRLVRAFGLHGEKRGRGKVTEGTISLSCYKSTLITQGEIRTMHSAQGGGLAEKDR